MDLDQVKAFLVLCEELHFGRTAERLFRSQSRVSRLVSALEREVGGALFERSSHHVRLTPLGAAFEARLRPAYTDLLAARDAAIAGMRDVRGDLRIGVTQTSDCSAVTRLAGAFTARHPGCTVHITEIDFWDPYEPLRSGEIDVLCNWLAVDEPDLRTGPVLEERGRVLMVGRGHRLAGWASVPAEELAAEVVQRLPGRYPSALTDALLPLRTPSGQPIRRAVPESTSIPEMIAQVAAGNFVRPTVEGIARWQGRSDVILVPITGLPPLLLGLIWVTARENARIRALADTAASRPRAGRGDSGRSPGGVGADAPRPARASAPR